MLSKPFQKALDFSQNAVTVQLDLVAYLIVQISSKIGILDLEEIDQELQNYHNQEQQQQETAILQQQQTEKKHPSSHVKVHFLQQFSKYWIMHNVGQDIIISYDEFRKIILKYSNIYNEKQEKFLKDYYESAHKIWGELILNKGNQRAPTIKQIKTTILRIVAHTLEKDINIEDEKYKDKDFGKSLFEIGHHFIENNLNLKENTLIKSVKENFDHSDHVKACKEYYKFFSGFIQEFFPQQQEGMLQKYSKMVAKGAYKLSGFVILKTLNKLDGSIDFVYSYDKDLQKIIDNCVSQETYEIDLEKLAALSFNDIKKTLQYLENLDNNIKQQPIKSILNKSQELRMKFTNEQQDLVLQDQAIKNKAQLIILKSFLIAKKCHMQTQAITVENLKKVVTFSSIQYAIYETKTLIVQTNRRVIVKGQKIVKQYYEQGKESVQFGKQATFFVIQNYKEVPSYAVDFIGEVKEQSKEKSLFSIEIYRKSLEKFREKKKNMLLQQQKDREVPQNS